MAKGQAGRRRGPAGKRAAGAGGGWRRVLLGFVAGVLVAVVAGVLLEWKTGWVGRLALGSMGMPRRLVTTGAAGAGGAGTTGAGARVQGTPRPVAPVPAPVTRGAEENGAAGVPGVPAATGGGQPPFGESEEVFEAGARVYGAQCASCHGRPGRAAAAEAGELAAGQFWTAKGGAAVARQPVGVIFREIAEGQPERQMPAYRRVLSEAQMWDLSLLLKNAGGELPDPVVGILKAGR